LRPILDKVGSFTGENDRAIHVAGRCCRLVTHSLTVEYHRQLAFVTVPPFGEIVAQGEAGNAIRPLIPSYSIEN
jgi:hypothetical protein